jgi:hypothetical protein
MIEWNVYMMYGDDVFSEIRSEIMQILTDVFFISDGGSHTWNPGRFPGRSGQWFSTDASATS